MRLNSCKCFFGDYKINMGPNGRKIDIVQKCSVFCLLIWQVVSLGMHPLKKLHVNIYIENNSEKCI